MNEEKSLTTEQIIEIMDIYQTSESEMGEDRITPLRLINMCEGLRSKWFDVPKNYADYAAGVRKHNALHPENKINLKPKREEVRDAWIQDINIYNPGVVSELYRCVLGIPPHIKTRIPTLTALLNKGPDTTKFL